MAKRFWNGLRRYVSQSDVPLMLLALVICVIGLVLIYSGCQSVARVRPQRIMLVQTVGIAAGFVAMILFSFLDFSRFPWLWVVAAVFNILFQLSLYKLGKEVGGNKSWIPLPGGINVQPGEVGKVIFIYTMASHMSLLRERKNNFWTILQLTVHMGATMAAVFVISRDLGVALMYPLIFLVMLVAGGVSWWWLAAAGGCAAGAFPLLWRFLSDGQKMRILVVFDPARAAGIDQALFDRYSWQAKQTVAAISNGELLGSGYLKGPRIQGGWVPESHTDSIFAVCGEEFGFIGCMVLLSLLTALVLRIFYDAWRSTDTFSRLVCAGVGGMFMWQIGINLGMNLGIFPVIGLTLPLVSYGGTSVLIMLTSLGLVCGAVRRIKPTWIRSADD
ncbi:MAG: FtsW/RodA/SpoVE family cell cycle protein [Clostridia bacterium]|nr:FtsW/RodA/SpoVE family cell cycle protein [Clostridia bacterium]